jgi:hypothetical protein
MDNIYENINKLYNKSGFLEKHGLELYFTIFIFIVFFITFSYLNVRSRIIPIKENWIKYRCHPSVIPFAGLINTPEGQSKISFTANNFAGCLNSILDYIVNIFLQPIYFVFSIFPKIMSGMIESLNYIRNQMYKIRNNMIEIVDGVYSRGMNVTVPIIQFITVIKDSIAKVHGIFTSSLFTLFGGYLTLQAFIESIARILIGFLIMLVGLIVILWIIPITWPAAALMTAAGIAVSVPLLALVMNVNQIFKLSISGIPKIPRCFDENCKIQLENGEYRSISKLKLGDKLYHGSIVTNIMECSTEDHEFYELNGVIVTGTHKVFDNNCYDWIYVKDHTESILIKNYNKPLMYCISTDSKVIKIGNLMFTDWDEFDDDCIEELTQYIKKNISHFNNIYNEKSLMSHYIHNNCNNYLFIHKYLDGGFVKDTQIELLDGIKKNIQDIKVNDVLKLNEKVLAIVKIDVKHMSQLYEYTICGKTIKGGPNLLFMERDNLGMIDTLNKYNKNISIQKINKHEMNDDMLYHLVTDKGRFAVDELLCADYNSTTDKFINNRRERAILSLFI